jgi:hypothetical protein
VSAFCPDGYVPSPEAIVTAMQYWFAETLAAIEVSAAGASATKGEPDSGVDALARALSKLSIHDALRDAIKDIVTETLHQLRQSLHQGKLLNASYFGDGLLDGCQAVKPDFWATPEADGVLESGIYWPFGRPRTRYEQRPNYPLFLLRSELGALLSEQQTAKNPLPRAKMPELVAAVRELGDKNRSEQLEALRAMFPRYHITDAVFRELAKSAPRKAGAKKRPRD